MNTSDIIAKLESSLKLKPKSLVLAEGDDKRVASAGLLALQRKTAKKVILIGDKERILAQLENIDPMLQGETSLARAETFIKQENLSILSPNDQDLRTKTEAHIKTRLDILGKSHNSVDFDLLTREPLLQAATLLSQGVVSASVAGAVHTTAQVIKAGLLGVGLADGIKTASSCFMMYRPDDASLFYFADCGVVVEPTDQQFLDITQSTVETCSRLSPTETPKVAFLSFSTKGSAHHDSQQKMKKAFEGYKLKNPDILCDGELQFDSAVVPAVAAKKCPKSPLGGAANILVFPNLDAGNIAYKIAQRLGGYEAYGPILQGFSKPFSDLSRGANVAEIYASCVISMRISQD